MARYVLIGAGGMLGRAFDELLRGRGDELRTYTRAQLDLLDARAVWDAAAQGDVVVNCAAFTDVDAAEESEELATRINGEAVGTLATACAAHGSVLLHYSTDYVFDGLAQAPYGVDHAHAPQNAYGRSKAAGERAIAAAGCAHLLVRTSWVYAPWGKNFVTTMAELTRTRGRLQVVDDQHGRPTSATHLASASLALLGTGARGTFHVADGGTCTWYTLACAVRDACGGGAAISPCNSAAFPRPASRPAYSVLDLARTEALLGKTGDWHPRVLEALVRYRTGGQAVAGHDDVAT